jgi:hypothetical protein
MSLARNGYPTATGVRTSQALLLYFRLSSRAPYHEMKMAACRTVACLLQGAKSKYQAAVMGKRRDMRSEGSADDAGGNFRSPNLPLFWILPPYLLFLSLSLNINGALTKRITSLFLPDPDRQQSSWPSDSPAVSTEAPLPVHPHRLFCILQHRLDDSSLPGTLDLVLLPIPRSHCVPNGYSLPPLLAALATTAGLKSDTRRAPWTCSAARYSPSCPMRSG